MHIIIIDMHLGFKFYTSKKNCMILYHFAVL